MKARGGGASGNEEAQSVERIGEPRGGGDAGGKRGLESAIWL